MGNSHGNHRLANYQYFRSENKPILYIFGVIAVMLCAAVPAIGIADIVAKSTLPTLSSVFLIAIFGLCAFAMMVLLLSGYVTRSDIVVEKHGIGYSRFNRIIKLVPWENIRRVVIYRLPNFEIFPINIDQITGYRLERSKRRFYWPMANDHIQFNEGDIKESRQLLDLINCYAVEYSIEFIDRRASRIGQSVARL